MKSVRLISRAFSHLRVHYWCSWVLRSPRRAPEHPDSHGLSGLRQADDGNLHPFIPKAAASELGEVRVSPPEALGLQRLQALECRWPPAEAFTFGGKHHSTEMASERSPDQCSREHQDGSSGGTTGRAAATSKMSHVPASNYAGTRSHGAEVSSLRKGPCGPPAGRSRGRPTPFSRCLLPSPVFTLENPVPAVGSTHAAFFKNSLACGYVKT